MDLSKKELAERLTEISSRYNDVCAIKKKMNDAVPDDNYERTIVPPAFPKDENCKINKALFASIDHTSIASAKKEVLAIYEDANEMPKKPEEPKKKSFVAPKRPGIIGGLRFLGGFSIFIAIFFILSRLTSTFSDSTEWTIPIMYMIAGVSAIAGIASIIASYVMQTIATTKEQALRAEFDKTQEKLNIEYSKQLKKHECELNEYRQREQEFLNEYWEWREIYLASLKEEELIKAKLEKDKLALAKDIEASELIPAQARLNEINDLITDEYLPAVDEIALLVRSGRADTLKEAINLYEELLYKEKQLQLQREVEKQRQLEAQMRRLDEERRHNEEMSFLAEQEYQRQRAEQRRIEQEERRYREEVQRREAQERARQAVEKRQNARREHEEATKMYAEHRNMQRQCNSCIHSGSCSMAFRRPNCASYRPK